MADTPTEGGRLPQHKVIAFGQNVTFVGQQKQNRLVGAVQAQMGYAEKGDRYTLEGFGLSDPTEIYDDFGDTPDGDQIDKHRRVGMFKTYTDTKKVGNIERAETLIDPANPTVMAMGWGMERRRDQTILKGMVGKAAYYDKEGDIAYSALPNSQKIAHDFNKLTKGAADGDAAPASAVVGLSWPKLRQMKIIHGRSDRERTGPIHIACTEEDIEFLRTSAEFSAERHVINGISRVADGETAQFGSYFFHIMPEKQLKADFLVGGAANRWFIPTWNPAVIHYKERPLVNMKVWERDEKRHRWYARYENQDSCVREYDDGVVLIEVQREAA